MLIFMLDLTRHKHYSDNQVAVSPYDKAGTHKIPAQSVKVCDSLCNFLIDTATAHEQSVMRDF